MGATEVGREKAVLFKLAIFIGIFLATAVLKDRLIPVKIETRLSIFNQYHHGPEGTWQHVKKQFFFTNTQEFLVLLFRILLSSFLKDMIIAVCSPSIFNSPISDRLIKKLETSPLDRSWIPETEEQMRRTLNGKTPLDYDGHTVIYSYGHESVKKCAKLSHESAKKLVRIAKLVRNAVEELLAKVVGVVVFSLRSLLCTVSSLFLLVLYGFQLSLRMVKIVYTFVEWLLVLACSCINDMSLLTVEIIDQSSLSNSEDIYENLKKSVEKLPELNVEHLSDDDDDISISSQETENNNKSNMKAAPSSTSIRSKLKFW